MIQHQDIVKPESPEASYHIEIEILIVYFVPFFLSMMREFPTRLN
jgi:hypothetical protein